MDVPKILLNFQNACAGWERLTAAAQIIEVHNQVIEACLRETVIISDFFFDISESDVTIQFQIKNETARTLASFDVIFASPELEALLPDEAKRFQWDLKPPLKPSKQRVINHFQAANIPYRGPFPVEVVKFKDIKIDAKLSLVIQQDYLSTTITQSLLERFRNQRSDFCRNFSDR